MSVIQFSVHKTVAAAVELESIKWRGRDAGVPDVRFDHSTVKAGSNRVRITTSVTMAVYLINRLRELAAKSQGELHVSTEEAIRLARQEIGNALYSPSIEDLERADV